jgi:hypothetical protein
LPDEPHARGLRKPRRETPHGEDRTGGSRASRYENIPVEVWVYEGGVMGMRGRTSLPEGGYDALLTIGGPRKSGARVRVDEETVESLESYVERAKSTYVAQILAACDGNRTRAAKLLGVDVRTVFRLLARMEGRDLAAADSSPPPSEQG